MATSGVELRAQIDNETFKALLIVNGGGAVALLTFLAALLNLNRPSLEPLTRAVCYGVILLVLGLGAAILHNYQRRHCSLIHEYHNMRPPVGTLLGIKLSEPTACFFSRRLMWLSGLLFMSAGLLVAIRGLQTL